MKYTKIKNMKISQLILGTVQLGINYGIANKSGLPDMQSRFNIITTALNGGVNTLDTAASYGESEKVIGEFIKKSGKTFNVVTKISGIKPDMTQKQVYEYCINSVNESMNKLKIDKIPVLLLHSYEELKNGGQAAIKALEHLKKENKIKIAGISLYASDDFDEILKHNIFEAVQIPMNIFDHRLITKGTLKRLKQKGLIVFVRSVFLQGLVFLDENNLPDKLTDAKPYIEKLNEISKRENIEIAQLALSFIRDLPEITGLVLGCETGKQIKQNIELIESPPLPDNVKQEILDNFSDVPKNILDPRTWIDK